MILRTLKTWNFRNLIDNPPEFHDGINVLFGDNAAGKTNTLEAIYLFATGKSFRTRSEKDFIRHGESFARAEIGYENSLLCRSMSVTYMASGAKALKGMQVEGAQVDKVSEFLGNFRAVLFTPDHLELVKGAPEERRRLIDMALCQIQPRFVKSLNDYMKVLAQRNNYLKSIKFSGKEADLDYLGVLNMQLSKSGAVITKQRGLYSQKLSLLSGNAYESLTSGSECLYARYISRACKGALSDEKEIAENLYAMYEKDTKHDIELGKTSHGPHHDELMIYVAKKGEGEAFANKAFEMPEENLSEYAARSFGSQGQQRSAVLSIKIAEGEIVKEKCGEYPVFLLDDLFSELDDKRRQKLSEMFIDKQCIITCCDRAALPKGADMFVINVSEGKYF
ncbi:MAG: DNA replication/repair protein RecF [Ruminococcaceae bacterium]|nr:DNA replication/repair protein RecF [Oscillospiraceae bacterium]